MKRGSEAGASLSDFSCQTPPNGERVATFAGTNESAHLQCFDAAGVRGQRTDQFTIFQPTQNRIFTQRVCLKLVTTLHLVEQVSLTL